jgi:hypothetical protein
MWKQVLRTAVACTLAGAVLAPPASGEGPDVVGDVVQRVGQALPGVQLPLPAPRPQAPASCKYQPRCSPGAP